MWTTSGLGTFNCVATWNELRSKGTEMSWWKLIWFHFNVPRHSFIGWLVVNNQLPTRERMMKWNLNVDVQCGFGKNSLETRNNILFECSFSHKIWKSVMALCLISKNVCYIYIYIYIFVPFCF
jgi:hypothetical protein